MVAWSDPGQPGDTLIPSWLSVSIVSETSDLLAPFLLESFPKIFFSHRCFLLILKAC